MDELTKIGKYYLTWGRLNLGTSWPDTEQSLWWRGRLEWLRRCISSVQLLKPNFLQSFVFGKFEEAHFILLRTRITANCYTKDHFPTLIIKNNASLFTLSLMFRVFCHYDVMHIINSQGKLLHPRTVREDKYMELLYTHPRMHWHRYVIVLW